jgi:D-glycero-D-manno-heptose 1,7-bisphosphate phosphatase
MRNRSSLEAIVPRCARILAADSERKSDLLRILFSEVNKNVRRPAIFVDRDGVINQRRPGDYVLDWSQFVFMPGIREALRQLASLGLPMIVISNQAAVGKGLLDRAGLEEITSNMYQALAADGTLLTAAYYCTHRPDENCTCRKPNPALLFTAAGDLNIDLSRSIFIGDSDTDVQAARRAGSKPVLLDSSFQDAPNLSVRKADLPAATKIEDLFPSVSAWLQDVQSC